MLPVYLKIKDFLSHKESEIDFTKLDNVTLIVGVNGGDPKKSNGAGKSTIFDAISWALFDKCRISHSKSTGLDNVVRHKAKKASVEFHFKLGDQLYRVVRTRDSEKRKSELTFQVRAATRWESVGMDKKTESNAKIAEIIGINYDVFVKSVLLEQHDVSGFAELTPGGRKEVVSQILQLDNYDKYQEYVKGQLDKIELELLQSDAFLTQNLSAPQEKADAEAELKLLDQRIDVSAKHVSTLKGLVEGVRTKLNEEQKKVFTYESLTKRQKELGVRLHQITTRMKDWTGRVEKKEEERKGLEVTARGMYDKLMELKDNRGDPEKIKRALERAREAKAKIDDECTDISVKVKTVLGKIQDIQDEIERIETLNEGECPTCFGAVTANSKTEALNTRKGRLDKAKELLVVYRAKLEEINTRRKAMEQEVTKAETARDNYNNSNREAKVLKVQWDTTRQQMLAVTQQITDATQEKQMNKEELDKIQNEMAQTLEALEQFEEFDDQAFKRLQAQIGEKVAELESIQKTLSSLQIKKGQLQERIEAKTATVHKIEEIKSARAKTDHERRLLKELVQAFGRTGIQALILENSAIEIEKIANGLLEKITDGKVSVQIITQKENKDGSVSEAFDIIITDEFHSSPFNMYSGGEKFRIAFAIRIALSTLLARRSGVKISAIFYDEAFTDLDADGVDKLMEIFAELSKEFRYQLVITHQTELKSQFNDVITVTKTEDGSMIKMER